MLKKTYFKAAGMFLFVVLCVLGFSYSLYDKDKPFEMKLIKEFKTAEEYEMYKKAHPEVFGVKKGEEKRIRVEGDRIRFYDEKGNLIRERRVYQGKEVFEAKDKYGKIEKFRLYSDFYISPKGDLVVEQRWKSPPPPSEEPGWVEKAIIYNGRGEITGEIDSLSIYPFILPESRYIIGISGGEGWADRKVHVYDMKGVIVKTIEFDIEYSDIAYAKISNDGEYALIYYSDADGSDAEIVLIDKDINIIWKKMCKPERLSEVSISSFGEYTAVILGKNNGEELIVWDKKGKMVYRRETSNVYMSDIFFLNTTRILIYEEYTNRNNPVFMVFLDPVTGEELYRYKYDWGIGVGIKVFGNILAIGFGATEEDKGFGLRSYISLFHWKASDEMFLKGGGR